MQRTLIGEMPVKVGESVLAKGWVDGRRDHGKIIFIDLRDRTGILQVVFTPAQKEVYDLVNQLRDEWVVEIRGVVAKRPENMQNTELATGSIELQASELRVLNQSETPPFPIHGEGREIEEELRLKYRYLDLRRERLQKNLRLRAKFIEAVRNFLSAENFVEIETPLLTKSTPEGSRDFLVPSRLQPGKFYALPQSPQQYKQLLMTAGFEKYFQIARALRDEDLRADRVFEHSQIDIEMSFVEREDVILMVEKMYVQVLESLGYSMKDKPFPHFTYKEAMEKFGADKFDLRNDEEKKNGVLAFAWVYDFPLFEKTETGGWTYGHNPFTGPVPEGAARLMKGDDIGGINSLQYDLVCNGHEVGGGGIRIHDAAILRRVLEIIGHSPNQIESQFGHMLEAFTYGTPPHGGIALGIERMAAILLGEDHIRETQAFPMNSSGRTAVMDAPSEVEVKQLKELYLKVEKKTEK